MQQYVVYQAGIVETLPGSITIFNVLPITVLYLIPQTLIKADIFKFANYKAAWPQTPERKVAGREEGTSFMCSL